MRLNRFRIFAIAELVIAELLLSWPPPEHSECSLREDKVGITETLQLKKGETTPPRQKAGDNQPGDHHRIMVARRQ